MLTDKEIKEKGYEEVADNLYAKEGNLYVQQQGQLKLASLLSDEQLDMITDLEAYKKLTKPKEEQKPPKKKDEKRPPEEKKRSTGEIILRDENEAHDLMNFKDDEQVLEEMRGKYLKEFVYSFEIELGEGKKRTVTGLSWAGVKEAARSAGNIEVDDLQIVEKEKSFFVKAHARDTYRNVAMFGVADQSKMMRLKTGEVVEDSHALSKCVSRAQRNAIRVLISEMTIKTIIEKYLSEKAKK